MNIQELTLSESELIDHILEYTTTVFNQLVIVVCESNCTRIRLFNSLISKLPQTELNTTVTKSLSMVRIEELYNTVRIATNDPCALRGYSANYVVCYGLIPSTELRTVLYPVIASTNGTLVLVHSPK